MSFVLVDDYETYKHWVSGEFTICLYKKNTGDEFYAYQGKPSKRLHKTDKPLNSFDSAVALCTS